MTYSTIDDPSQYFQQVLYSGDDSTDREITNTGNSNLQPDLVWIKCRNDSFDHVWMDSSRGASTSTTGKQLSSNLTAAEPSNTNGHVKSFNSDGFNVRSGSSAGNPLVGVNKNAKTYIAWQWKANGGTTSSNTSGTITSTVQANTTAGFSIATYTGNGTAGATFGHGLGVVPSWVIVKSRDSAQQWAVYHHKNTDAPETEILNLNLNNATVDNANRWNDTAPTSTLLTIKQSGEVNVSGEKYVAYFWNDIQGFSKFGEYKGNGSTNGTFVYTGFKPAWVMIKRTDAAKNWYIFNNQIAPDNVVGNTITANNADAESGDVSTYMDFLSNGFKWRQNFSHGNADGGTHVYMAFAEHHFVSSEGVPVTAR